jgi:putative two-component system response regulator
MPNLFTPAAKGTDDSSAAQKDRLLAELGQRYHECSEALRALTQAHHHALLRLALTADFRANDKGLHILRIGFLAEALALLLDEPVEFAHLLRRAAPMHDVGKSGVPDAVLKKPGLYNDEERQLMNAHAVIGAQLLGCARTPLFRLAAEVAMTHHERWDGGGYPLGLAGTAIPVAGRIVAVVDFFDALTMARSYRPAYSDAVALQMMVAQRGFAFDPWVVDTYLANADALIAMRERLNAQPPSFETLVDDC